MSRGRGWQTPIPPGRWQERLQEYDEAVARGVPLQHMADIVRSVIASGRADELGSAMSHFDLIVAAQPADEPPFDVVAVRTLAGLRPPPKDRVRIEHQSLTGHDDVIERPVSEAVRLFWRFVIEKFGIEPVAPVLTDWGAVRHAYGSADDVPGLLAAAAASPTPSGQAWDEVWSRLYHQGTVYSASFAAIPLLTEIAQRAGVGGYVPALHLVAAIVAAAEGPPERTNARSRYSRELADLRDMAEQGLARASDDTEFVYGIEALMAFEDGGVWQRHLNHVADGELPFDCPNCGEHLLLDLVGPGFLLSDFSDASVGSTQVETTSPADSIEARLIGLAQAKSHGRPTIADVYLLAALLLCAAGYAEGGRLAAHMPGWQVIAWGVLLAAPVNLVVAGVALAHEPVRLTGMAIVGMAYIAAISQFGGFVVWYRGMGLIGVARASQLQLAQPLLTLAWAVLLMGETLTPLVPIAALAVLGCIVITQRASVPRPIRDSQEVCALSTKGCLLARATKVVRG